MASEGQQLKMRDKSTYIEFEKHNAKLLCPFVIYGGFERLTTSSKNAKKIYIYIENINQVVIW